MSELPSSEDGGKRPIAGVSFDLVEYDGKTSLQGCVGDIEIIVSRYTTGKRWLDFMDGAHRRNEFNISIFNASKEIQERMIEFLDIDRSPLAKILDGTHMFFLWAIYLFWHRVFSASDDAEKTDTIVYGVRFWRYLEGWVTRINHRLVYIIGNDTIIARKLSFRKVCNMIRYIQCKKWISF